MATSATGRANNRQGDHPAASNGFTLLEVLVVLVIISVIVGLAVLSVNTAPEELRREGNRLASLLELTAEEAVMNGREYRLVLHRRDYAFELLQEGKWRPSGDEMFRPRRLPEGMTLQLLLENQPQPLSENDADAQAEPVAIMLLSSGEISPFELRVSDATTGEISIRSDGNAITTVPAP